jgi:hypothetical protein
MNNSEIVETKNNNNMEVPCFLFGLGAGVALTLLFAPLSGDRTRRLIGRRVKDGRDWVKDKANAAGEAVTSNVEGLRNRVKEAAEVLVAH